MNRKIIQIDQEKCVGCGLCVSACQQGAIQLIDGKAQLIHDDYCDGLGRCLPKCPVDAISFSDRDIVLDSNRPVPLSAAADSGCPSSQAKVIEPTLACGCPGTQVKVIEHTPAAPLSEQSNSNPSQLRQWPIQIKLVPPNAPYFQGAKLLIAADCTAFANADFHNKFIKNHIVLIGCPKLDDGDYSVKLTEIIKNNDIKSIKIVRMEVPCCAGIVNATAQALQNSGKLIPWQIVTIATDGTVLED